MAKSKKKTKSKAKPKSVFNKGQIVWIALHGAGVTSYEEAKVLSVKDGKVLLDNGPGNTPDGPFDAVTGKDLRDQTYSFGFTTELLSEKPEGYKPDE